MTTSPLTPQSKKISPLLWVATVYFSMGLPYVLISDISVLAFKDLGISDAKITFWTSLLVLPWSLKPLFSPIMELVGTKKRYVFVTELVSAIVLGLVCAGLGVDDFFVITLMLLAIMAFSGSIHDIAGDGTYMAELNAHEQSMYIGWQGAFYNLAKILAKGGLVYLVGRLSSNVGVLNAWRVIFLIAGVVMLCMAIYHFFVLPGRLKQPKEEVRKRTMGEAMEEFLRIFLSFFQKKHIVFYLVFILLYRFTEGLAIKVAPLFLKSSVADGGMGLTNEQFGLFYGTIGTACFILGSILSGYFISHYGLRRVLFALALIFNIPFIVFFLFAQLGPLDAGWIATGIAFEQFGYGFGFVGLNLFMMQQVAPGPHQMAHYAIANSLMNLGVMIPGMMSGFISDAVGYKTFFLIAVLIAIPGIICAKIVPFTYDHDGKRLE